jgi:Trypsin
MPTPEPNPPVRRNSPRWRARSLAIALCLTSVSAVACHEAPPDLAPVETPAANPTDTENQSLIGGFSANDPRLDSIGAMVLIPPFPGAQNEHLCGASVIGPETLVTAKHCVEVIPLAMSFGYKLGFAVGPDIRRPKRMYELAAFATAPGDEGGFVGMGRDVAVLHLEHPLPPELKPLDIGTLSDEDIGKAFAAIGYGIQDNAENHGTRRLGRQTLKGREGRTLEHLFGAFEKFLEWLSSQVMFPDSGDGGAPGDGGIPSLEQFARFLWDSTVLEKGYEVVTGGFPGDAQPCYGDSGSSLVKYQDGKYVSYGVVSGGLGTSDLICDLGAVYATFGPEVSTFLDQAKGWVDPCGDMDTRGTCDGNVAKRCTNMVEGRRRVVEFDCGLVGMECNTQTGQVSCDANVFGPPPPTRPTPPSPPPEIREMVDRVFKGLPKK